MFTLVAVVTRAEGFTTLTGLIPALAFHAVSSVLGLQLLASARKRAIVPAEEAATA